MNRAHAHPIRSSRPVLDALRVLRDGAALVLFLAVAFLYAWLGTP